VCRARFIAWRAGQGSQKKSGINCIHYRNRVRRRTGASGVREHIEQVKVQADRGRPEEVLRWAFSTFKDDVAMASGGGVEGMVLLDIAARVNPKLKVFTLDTEFLFPETYDLIDRVEKRYGIRVERIYSALTPEEQEKAYGSQLWKSDPDQCCNLRKVEP